VNAGTVSSMPGAICLREETRPLRRSFRKSDRVRLALARMELAGEAVAQAVIRDLDGRSLPLGELWSERPVVLVFLRHFG
jgi:hypothetical protein